VRILYIEDNPNDAKLVKRYIETTSHELVITPSIEETVEVIKEADSFDLVMVDILIDNQRTGYEIPQMLRTRGYTSSVVAVTGLSSPQDQLACETAGFEAVLTKPFLITTLADLITQFG
jgi:CheY-like chemotaxis protein